MGGKTAEIQISEDFCKGCGLCVNACPQHLLHTSKRVAKTSYHPAEFEDPEAKCTGCALCALVCPDTAIRISRKKRNEGKEQ